MLSKLLKYDLKYMIKNMCPFYILAIFFAIVTRILFSLNQTVIVQILGQISVGCMFSMTVSTIMNTVIRSWVRFKDSLYRDEAYLTHTLPVTKNQIYNSMFIETLIFFVVGFAVAILALFITYYTKARWLVLTTAINKITTGLNFNTALFVTGFLAVVFLEIFNAIQCGYLGMILGFRQSNGKIGYSVLFGFAAYLIAQSLVLSLVFVAGLFDSSIMALFNNEILLDTGVFKLLMLLSVVLYVVIIFIMSIVCKKILNKGVNIE